MSTTTSRHARTGRLATGAAIVALLSVSLPHAAVQAQSQSQTQEPSLFGFGMQPTPQELDGFVSPLPDGWGCWRIRRSKVW